MTIEAQRTAAAPRGIALDTLVSSAAALFARQGYRATTLSDIAEALGVKKASLYHYIESKEDLLTAIYQRIFDRIEATVGPLASLDFSPDERLRRMLHAHITVVAEELDMLAVTFREETELPDQHQRLIKRRKRRYERLFEDILEEGKRSGVFRADVPSRVAVFGMLGACNWMYKWYDPARGSADEIGAAFALLFESGIASDAGARSGAWPRAETVDEAFELAEASVRTIRIEIDRLTSELTRARDRLRDGLARPERG